MDYSHHENPGELPAAKESIIASLRDQVRVLNSQVDSLKQGQDYRSYYGVQGTPHHIMQQRLANIRVEIQAWARMVAKSSKDGGNGNIGNNPLLGLQTSNRAWSKLEDVLKGVCPENTFPEVLKEVKLLELIAAITSNLVVREAVVNPLGGCTPQMRQMTESPIYKAMTSEDAPIEHRRAARLWQASCLKLYSSSLQASDTLGTPNQKSDATKKHIDKVISIVLTTLKPVFHIGKIPSQSQACQWKLRYVIEDATRIGADLAKLHSGLVIMDKKWFETHQASEHGFISPSQLGGRIELKSTEATRLLPDNSDGQYVVEKGTLALVLFPGLLKYGSDDGENWECWTVWTPANITLTDFGKGKDGESRQGANLQRPQLVRDYGAGPTATLASWWDCISDYAHYAIFSAFLYIFNALVDEGYRL